VKLSLSTNWCNRRIESGEEIADLAMSLGFAELELGYHTTPEQVKGFKTRLDRIPVGSVHAFCPVPISAPQGYPELYPLASFDEEARKIAHVHVGRNIVFAASIGADTLVLHAGRVLCDAWTLRGRLRKRRQRGEKLLDGFRTELESLVPELERNGVTLAIENLPYYEGFPNEEEMARIWEAFRGAPIRAWFDTGHHRVRECCGWLPPDYQLTPDTFERYRGMHLNDVVDINDDHLAPGFGKVDFAALKPLAESVRHVVFEPCSLVGETALRNGVEHIREIWGLKQ